MRLASLRQAACVASLVVLVFAGRATAQVGNVAGVHVDTDGVLRMQIHDDPDGELNRQRIAQAVATLKPDVAAKSPLRKVSLTRLEREVAKRVEAGAAIPDEMRYLAGLTRIKYVFFYPDTHDVVIAGPAEGWAADLAGRVVSASGRPVIELQDLVVALRAFPPNGDKPRQVGCSIDPTPEGLARMQQFLVDITPRATPNDEHLIVDGLRNSLGLQKVSVQGVPAKTHFAQVMVEADYRMKLIGIGLELPPIKLATYVDKARPGASASALARWYFVPDYECVRVSDDELAMELVGDGVKLISESEYVAADGARHQSAKRDKASETFAAGFTKKYGQLADRSPVFAQLRDIIDMSVAAAFIQQRDYYGKADWQLGVFGDEAKFPVETYAAPTQVETAITSVWKGSQLMTPVGGGVVIQAERALTSKNLLADEGHKVSAARAQTKLELAADKWWWD